MSEQPTVRVVVNPDVCVGIGQCEALFPDAFEYDEAAGYAHVRDGAVLSRSAADAAVRNCPSGAISIVDEEG